MIFDLLCETPPEIRDDPCLSLLKCLPDERDEVGTENVKVEYDRPFQCLSEPNGLFDLHDFDMIQILCYTADQPPVWVHFALFDDP